MGKTIQLQPFPDSGIDLHLFLRIPRAEESFYTSVKSFPKPGNQFTPLQKHSPNRGINLHVCKSIPQAGESIYTSAKAFPKPGNQLTRLQKHSPNRESIYTHAKAFPKVGNAFACVQQLSTGWGINIHICNKLFIIFGNNHSRIRHKAIPAW